MAHTFPPSLSSIKTLGPLIHPSPPSRHRRRSLQCRHPLPTSSSQPPQFSFSSPCSRHSLHCRRPLPPSSSQPPQISFSSPYNYHSLPHRRRCPFLPPSSSASSSPTSAIVLFPHNRKLEVKKQTVFFSTYWRVLVHVFCYRCL